MHGEAVHRRGRLQQFHPGPRIIKDVDSSSWLNEVVDYARDIRGKDRG